MSVSLLKENLLRNIETLNGEVSLSVKYLDDKEEININEKKQFWAASVIKILIAGAFFKLVKEGKLNPNTKIKTNPENIVRGTGVLKILNPDNRYSLMDYVNLMISFSDNTATNQIIDITGWEMINNYANEIGLFNTTFKHKMMITEGRGPNLSTTEDIKLLLEKLYNKELPGSEEIISMMKEQYDRTRIPLLIPNEVEIANKCGSLPNAMHDVGIIYSKRPFIFVFFSDDQKDKRHTNEVLSLCAKLCFDYSDS